MIINIYEIKINHNSLLQKKTYSYHFDTYNKRIYKMIEIIFLIIIQKIIHFQRLLNLNLQKIVKINNRKVGNFGSYN